MNSGASADISLGSQCSGATEVMSSYQTSRWRCQAMSAPVRLQTITLRTE